MPFFLLNAHINSLLIVQNVGFCTVNTLANIHLGFRPYLLPHKIGYQYVIYIGYLLPHKSPVVKPLSTSLVMDFQLTS
jgi:hypothetical protein